MLRKVDKQSVKTQFFEVNKTLETAPGEKVFYAIPQTPNDRPKSQTVTTKGEKGTLLNTKFDQDGNVTETSCECPEIKRQNEILTSILQKELNKNIESEKESKGIDINIIVIAAMAFIFLFLDKRV